MSKVIVPSYKADLPVFEPRELGEKDIAVEFHGNWYLVGDLAQLENPAAERMQHGDFSSAEMKLLTKAAIAKAVGRSAEISTTAAISAPIKSIHKFRETNTETHISPSQLDHLRKAVEDIKFRLDSTDGDVKTINATIDKAIVVSELAAVNQTIPEAFLRYALLQWGHGDLQLVCVDDGKVVGEPYSTQGFWGALRHFQKISGLKPSHAQKAFREGYRFGESMNTRIDCLDEIEKAIEHHIMTDFPAIFNNMAKHEQHNLVISGGSIHNKTAMAILKQEATARGIDIWEIHELEGSNVEDPIYSCLTGLSEFGDLRFDLGHSAIKAEFGGLHG